MRQSTSWGTVIRCIDDGRRISTNIHEIPPPALGSYPSRHSQATAVQRLVRPLPSRNNVHKFQRPVKVGDLLLAGITVADRGKTAEDAE